MRSTSMTHSSGFLVALLGVATALWTACGDAYDDEPTQVAGSEAEHQALAATYGAPSANGLGCPAGTWSVEGDARSGTLRYRFDAYDAALSSTKSVTNADCLLTFPSGYGANYRVAVRGLAVGLYAGLSAGADLRLTASAGYLGKSPGWVHTFALNGPVSQAYQNAWEIAESERSYTPCGATRDLTLTTRIRVGGSGTGSVRLTEVKYVELDIKPCN